MKRIDTSREYKKKNFSERLIAFFSSLQCTVSLLLASALLCVLGTLIPQKTTPLMNTGPVGRILSGFNPFDLFHSYWLGGIFGLLCLNIVLCMRRRIRACKHNTRYWAVIGLHISIILIFAGMLAGRSGLDASLALQEGQSASEIQTPDGNRLPLGFSVRCEEFQLELYPSGMPKEYISRLVFSKQEAPPTTGDLKVNHPIVYEGLRFYQESYQQIPEALLQFSNGETAWTLKIHEGELFTTDQGRLRMHVVKITDNLMQMGPAVKLVYDHAGEQGHMWIFREIDSIKQAIPDIFERAATFNPELIPPYTFALKETGTTYVTGIGIKNDPGVPLVATGAALFLACLLIVLLMPKRLSRAHLKKQDEPADKFPCVSAGATRQEQATTTLSK